MQPIFTAVDMDFLLFAFFFFLGLFSGSITVSSC